MSAAALSSTWASSVARRSVHVGADEGSSQPCSARSMIPGEDVTLVREETARPTTPSFLGELFSRTRHLHTGGDQGIHQSHQGHLVLAVARSASLSSTRSQSPNHRHLLQPRKLRVAVEEEEDGRGLSSSAADADRSRGETSTRPRSTTSFSMEAAL